jgi:hypothetical protein
MFLVDVHKPGALVLIDELNLRLTLFIKILPVHKFKNTVFRHCTQTIHVYYTYSNVTFIFYLAVVFSGCSLRTLIKNTQTL